MAVGLCGNETGSNLCPVRDSEREREREDNKKKGRNKQGGCINLIDTDCFNGI